MREKTKSQYQLCQEALSKLSGTNAHFMEMVHHPTNPLTNEDLRRLVERFPERWGRFAGFIGKLPN